MPPPLWDERGQIGFEHRFHGHRPGGWDTAEADRWYAPEGRRPHRELERRLGREVVLDPWPVEGER